MTQLHQALPQLRMAMFGLLLAVMVGAMIWSTMQMMESRAARGIFAAMVGLSIAVAIWYISRQGG